MYITYITNITIPMFTSPLPSPKLPPSSRSQHAGGRARAGGVSGVL